VDEVRAQEANLATEPAGWHRRMAGVADVSGLVSALQDLERELNVLGDGLPKGSLATCLLARSLSCAQACVGARITCAGPGDTEGTMPCASAACRPACVQELCLCVLGGCR
jgi:hypothetical protein